MAAVRVPTAQIHKKTGNVIMFTLKNWLCYFLFLLFSLYQVLTSVYPDILNVVNISVQKSKIVNKTFLNQFLVVCTQFFFLQLQILPFTNLSVSSDKSLHSPQNTICFFLYFERKTVVVSGVQK